MTEYKGYSLFEDVENDLLQAWNRCNTIANINKDVSEEAAQEYFDMFNKVEQMKIKMLLLMVSTSGKDEVQKRINETLQLEDE